MFDWDARARRDGMSLAVIPGPPVVQRVFEIAGVMDRLAPGAIEDPLPGTGIGMRTSCGRSRHAYG